MIDNLSLINLTERFLKRELKVKMNSYLMTIEFERLNLPQEKFLNRVQKLKLRRKSTKMLKIYSTFLEFQVLKHQNLSQKKKSFKFREIFDNRFCKLYRLMI